MISVAERASFRMRRSIGQPSASREPRRALAVRSRNGSKSA